MTPLQGTKKIVVNGDEQTVLEDYALIEKRDRAGTDGKNIMSPNCENTTRIYGLAWSTYPCPHCKATPPKYNGWLIDQLDTWRTPR